MKRFITTFSLFLCLLTALHGIHGQQESQSPLPDAVAAVQQYPGQYSHWQEVRAADRAFVARAGAVGRGRAFLEFLGEGSVVFRQGPVDAIALYSELDPQNDAADTRRGTSTRGDLNDDLNHLDWRAHYIDVSRDGDLGITAGPYVADHGNSDPDDADYGHLISVWRRQDGRWLLMADIGAPLPGYLSLDVSPDYADTLAVLDEAARPPMAMDEHNIPQRLTSADELYGRAINFRGGRRALLRYGLENVRVYLPGMAPAVGVEAASSVYGAFLDNRLFTINPVTPVHAGGYLSTSRDLGYTYGVMSTAMPEEGQEQGFRTNYLRVWRLNGSNEWRVAIEVLSPY